MASSDMAGLDESLVHWGALGGGRAGDKTGGDSFRTGFLTPTTYGQFEDIATKSDALASLEQRRATLQGTVAG